MKRPPKIVPGAPQGARKALPEREVVRCSSCDRQVVVWEVVVDSIWMTAIGSEYLGADGECYACASKKRPRRKTQVASER